MIKITTEQIRKLRTETKAGVMDCRQALLESKGNMKKAQEWLRKKGIASAKNRSDRETLQGVVKAYSHAEGRILAVVELLCETDFVAKTDDFQKLAHELCMQVAAMKPKDSAELLKQAWIRDEKKTIESLVKELSGKTGENIVVGRVARFELGEGK